MADTPPQEPTHEMICASDGQDGCFGSVSARMYRAMVAARPTCIQPPQQE